METQTQTAVFNPEEFDLRSRAVMVRFVSGMWRASRLDKKSAREIAEAHGADPKMLRTTKRLLEESAIKPIQKVVNEARAYHYEHTVPYLWEGIALLPAKDLWTYQTTMARFEKQFDERVHNFLFWYADARTAAANALGDLFDESDYPPPCKVQEKFRLYIETNPLPSSDHLVLDVSQDIVERIAESAREMERAAVRKAQAACYQRMKDALQRIVDTLPAFNPTAKGSDRGSFKDSLISNVADLCTRLKSLNMADDPQLEQIRQDMEKTIAPVSPDALRQDQTTRDTVTDRARELLTRIDQYGGIFGGGGNDHE